MSNNTINASEALAKVVGYEDNEITAYPWWAIVSVGSFGRLVIHAGPWFSRKRATDYLNGKRYNFPKSAHVFCFSGHESSDFRELHDAAKAVAKGASHG